MLARLRSAALFGVDPSLVHVEVDVSNGLPAFNTVGLPDSSVRESRDRVRSAIENSGFEFPAKRITINLAPADVRKRGTSFDLAIAVGVLAATGVRDPARVRRTAAARRAVARRPHPARARRAAGSAGGAAPQAGAARSRSERPRGGVRPGPGDPPRLFAGRHRGGAQRTAHGAHAGAHAVRGAAAGRRPRAGRHQGPADGQARAGDRRRRPSQPPLRRSAGRRQDHDGPQPARHPPGARFRRGSRNDRHPLRARSRAARWRASWGTGRSARRTTPFPTRR